MSFKLIYQNVKRAIVYKFKPPHKRKKMPIMKGTDIRDFLKVYNLFWDVFVENNYFCLFIIKDNYIQFKNVYNDVGRLRKYKMECKIKIKFDYPFSKHYNDNLLIRQDLTIISVWLDCNRKGLKKFVELMHSALELLRRYADPVIHQEYKLELKEEYEQADL